MLKSVLVSIVTFSIFASSKDCQVPPAGFWMFTPLVYHENGVFYPTEIADIHSVVVVPDGDKVILGCGPSRFAKRNLEFVTAYCDHSGKFIGSEAGQSYEDLYCDGLAVDEVLAAVPGCPEDKASVQFGYVHPIDNAGHIVGEACFSPFEGRTLFAHVRRGSDEFVPLAKVGKGFFRAKHPETRHRIEFIRNFNPVEIKTKLETLLDTDVKHDILISTYIGPKLLSHDQLKPTRRLVWNFLTLFKNTNLEILEEEISNIPGNVDIYKGSHGVFTVGNSSMFISGEKFPIPDIIWLVVRKGGKAAAFAVFNNPFATTEEIRRKAPCTSKCQQVSWLNNQIPNPTSRNTRNGVVFCCEYGELRRVISEIPALNGITDFFV